MDKGPERGARPGARPEQAPVQTAQMSAPDLIVRLDQKVSTAILSVGGFLGVGSKLVSVPYTDLHIHNGKVVLGAATKESLTALPAFNYAAQ